MIERLNHADIINQLNQGRKDLERYPESGAEYSYENAFHSVIMKKINELIDKINELDSYNKSKELDEYIKPSTTPLPLGYYPHYPTDPYYPYGLPYTTCSLAKDIIIEADKRNRDAQRDFIYRTATIPISNTSDARDRIK